MNDKQAHDKLREINKQRNTIGVGGYEDSRRNKCGQHEKFNTAMKEMSKISDEQRMREADND